MKLAVVGSTDFPLDKCDDMFKVLDRFHAKYNVIWFISEGADGAAIFAEEWAKKNNLSRMIMRPNRKAKSSGASMQNKFDVVEKGDVLLCFTNGSKGTSHCIAHAKKIGKPLCVINFDCKIVEKDNWNLLNEPTL